MSGLTFQNICAILWLSDVGFACVALCLAERPDWVTVPARNVVYYAARRLDCRKESCDARHIPDNARTCVLHNKQSPLQDSVAWTALSTTVLGETGEEALPLSARIAVWVASPVLKPAQSLVKQETAYL